MMISCVPSVLSKPLLFIIQCVVVADLDPLQTVLSNYRQSQSNVAEQLLVDLRRWLMLLDR
jgi:hypothetical protein